ncbi:MAG TPA: low molecular weight protein-tyrosine-phosphatase [Steroidobacteraceae bacterium]|nr:low molecular weight protein-tyrosine-phosphatase [Steroidobacteraceae bacterium]
MQPKTKSAYKVLFVCLGNICRSPTAEGVLRHLAAKEAPQLSLEIDSAGTADYHIGAPPDPRSQRAARKRGIDISGLKARQVAVDDFARFDLILAMDAENLRELRAMQPRNSRAALKLFLEYAPDLKLRDVPDPYYRDAAAFEEVLDLTTAASRGLLAALQEGAQQPIQAARERDGNR